MRDEAKKLLVNIVEVTHSWMPPTIAWGQRYIVTTACRMLYTIKTGEVTSKAHGLD
ncbi:aminoglycoside adenylyltransferase domain-containing protein [Paenibacillus sp. yr247]|uniref:aminoglycoside adenylyltransferase domain-containing protein n=1 Tax=Paenibacillus sp. yr247 TaxID=1761880 RepID=UPI000B82182E|nr:aminoglycoside adenylyltransferase domain-containing protein [Paenibacillus sp. yr247]